MDVLKEGGFQKITPKPVFVLSPENAHLPEGMKLVHGMIALLSERKYDVIIFAPIRELEARNLRPRRSGLTAKWSDISNAMRGFKDHSLDMLVLDGVLGLELSSFSRKLKMKPGIDDDHQKTFGISNDLRKLSWKLWQSVRGKNVLRGRIPCWKCWEQDGPRPSCQKFTRDSLAIQ